MSYSNFHNQLIDFLQMFPLFYLRMYQYFSYHNYIDEISFFSKYLFCKILLFLCLIYYWNNIGKMTVSHLGAGKVSIGQRVNIELQS